MLETVGAIHESLANTYPYNKTADRCCICRLLKLSKNLSLRGVLQSAADFSITMIAGGNHTLIKEADVAISRYDGSRSIDGMVPGDSHGPNGPRNDRKSESVPITVSLRGAKRRGNLPVRCLFLHSSSIDGTRRFPGGELPRRGKRSHPGVRP